MHGFEQQEFKEDFKVNLVPIKREYNRSGGFISECQSKDELEKNFILEHKRLLSRNGQESFDFG